MPHLFYPTINSCTLKHEEVKERFDITEPCFIDNTNLIPSKKNNMLEYRLVAILKNNTWKLASLVKLVFGKALLLTCSYNPSDSTYSFDKSIPILITDTDQNCLRYLDLLLPSNKSNTCTIDGMAQVSTYGPNSLRPPSNLLSKTELPVSNECYSILRAIPNFINSTWKVFRKTPLPQSILKRPSLATKNQLVIRCTGPSNKLALVKTKGFAFPLHPEEATSFVYLSRESANALIAKKELSLKEYQHYLHENRIDSITTKTVNIPVEGLRIEFEDDPTKSHITPTKFYRTLQPTEHFESRAITLSHYIHQKCISIYNPQSFLRPFIKTFNFFTFKRSGADALGTNYYQSVNNSNQPNPTARKGPSTIIGSCFWRESWDPTWLPLCNKVVNELVKFSLDLECQFCPLTDSFSAKAYQSAGHQISKNRFGNINILTFGNQNLIGFANEEHVDNNDWLGRDTDQEAEKLLYSIRDHARKIFENIKSYKDQTNPECQARLSKYVKISTAFKYILNLGMLGLKRNDIPRYESPTTCGYKFVDERRNPCGFVIYAYFLHPSISIAVQLATDIFHWFRAARHSHHTSVPVLFNKETETIRFHDEDVMILAWGGGGSEARTQQAKRRRFYLANQGPGWQNPGGLRVTAWRFRALLDSLSDQQVLNANAQGLLREDDINHINATRNNLIANN